MDIIKHNLKSGFLSQLKIVASYLIKAEPEQLVFVFFYLFDYEIKWQVQGYLMS